MRDFLKNKMRDFLGFLVNTCWVISAFIVFISGICIIAEVIVSAVDALGFNFGDLIKVFFGWLLVLVVLNPLTEYFD